MAKQIIILERNDGQPVQFRVALWFAVAVARQSYYANPAKTSAWKDIAAGELTALQDGSVYEEVQIKEVASGATLPQVEAELENLWTSRNAAFQASNVPNRYGSFWDGTSWTVTNN